MSAQARTRAHNVLTRTCTHISSLDTDYTIFNGEDPIVTKTQCFDDLLIPPEHPGRQVNSDTSLHVVARDCASLLVVWQYIAATVIPPTPHAP